MNNGRAGIASQEWRGRGGGGDPAQRSDTPFFFSGQCRYDAEEGASQSAFAVISFPPLKRGEAIFSWAAASEEKPFGHHHRSPSARCSIFCGDVDRAIIRGGQITHRVDRQRHRISPSTWTSTKALLFTIVLGKLDLHFFAR